MKEKNFFKDFLAFIPLFISGILCICLLFFLWQKWSTTPSFSETLALARSTFLSLSGALAAIIMVYLAFAATTLKGVRNKAIENLNEFTQKMHHFRNILELLIRSKMWMNGLKEYVDEEFAGLTFFEVKEFYKGKSKLAIEFLQEQTHYDDTENLYLEVKSLLMTDPKEKQLPESIRYPNAYKKEIVSKWIEHKCGSGLWYYFVYKYGEFKESLDYNLVYERHQEKIMTLANTIDHEAFQDSSFNEVFLAKLGEYMVKQVIPKLYHIQGRTEKALPGLMRYLYLIFLFLVFFGVLAPLMQMLLGLSEVILIVSFSFVTAILFFIAISLFQFINKEVNN